MRNLLATALAVNVVLVLMVTTSSAAERSAYAAVTSDYVFRGLSSSKDGIAVQGGYNIQQSQEDLGWYAGSFVSTVGNISDDGLEVDVYAGWKGVINKNLDYAVGGTYYQYTDNFYKDKTELYVGVNYETAYLKIFSGNISSGGGTYNYIDIGATFIVLQDIDLNVHYGRYSSSTSDYNDLSASMTLKVKGIDLGIGATYGDLKSTKNIKLIVTATKIFDL